MVKKYIRNAGKPYTPAEIKKIKELANKNTPTRVMGLILGRPVKGLQTKVSKLKISLKPTNQKPYNRNKKKK